MLLGGRVSGEHTVLGTPVALIPAYNIPKAVERIVTLFRDGRHPGETFLKWIDRLGPASLGDSFKDLQSLPNPTENPEVYRDWGEDTAFVLQTGESECAA